MKGHSTFGENTTAPGQQTSQGIAVTPNTFR